MSHLLASFDAILSDLDGVVYAGPDPIPGAVPALNRAQREGVAVAYVTNNASRSVGTVAEHLNALGLHTDAEHVVSSAQAAARLAADIEEFSGVAVPVGHLDITLYRDDLRRHPARAPQPTAIPAGGIDGKTVVLVDDVLYSGRTIRAAFDALRDLGLVRRRG